MKEILTVVSLLISGVVCEAPAPYAPSGWRPDGPSFELPQRIQPPPQKQQYLPPVDPRIPLTPNNFDDADVSVQGLPGIEQQPIFEVSPINGQQYTGPSINADIAKLHPSFQQAQYQQQLEKARQFARQREFETTRAKVPSNGLPNQLSPRQFASQQTTTTTLIPELKTLPAETTTESINLNEGETLEESKDTKDKKDKVSVEVSKQNLQEYPPELFLSPLAQLRLQPQLVPLSQFGQLRAPLIYQPEQTPQTQGFDGPAHLSALPSVLAQRQLFSQQTRVQGGNLAQNPIIVQEPALIQEMNQYEPVPKQYQLQSSQPAQRTQPRQPTQQQDEDFRQSQAQPVTVQRQQTDQFQPDNQYQAQLQYQPQPQQQLQPNQSPQPQFQFQPDNQYQAQLQFQPQPQLQLQTQLQPNQFPQPQFQFQPQPQLQFQPNQFPQPQLQFQPQPQLQQQPNQFTQPQRPKDVEEIEQNDQQVVYQNYQPQFYQPQFQAANQYQNPEQPLLIAQPAFAYQNQEQYYQNQFPQQQYDPQLPQSQEGQPLQSGLDINQQGNDIDQTEEQEPDDKDYDEGSKATAVATAFGTRTQPRVFAKYGAPIPKVQENPDYQTTAEPPAQDEPQDDDSPAIAQATAVATGRRNAKLRGRRVRPVFTVDRSGHLVLA